MDVEAPVDSFASAADSDPARAAWPSYDPAPFFVELVGPTVAPRPSAEQLWNHFAELGPTAPAERQLAADCEIRAIGVTFTDYYEGVGVDRPWPFDVIPRIIQRDRWQVIEAGPVLRLSALNLFIDDCYHDQRAVSEGVVPADLVTGSSNFRRKCVGVDPPGESGPTSAGATSSGTTRGRGTSWRATCGCRPGSPTCSRTATSSTSSLKCSGTTASDRSIPT